MNIPTNHIPPSILEQISNSLQTDGIQKTVVGAVIIIEGKVLVLERTADDFMGGLVEIPSGTVDSHEDLMTALAREVQEETALTIMSIDTYLGAFDYFSNSGKTARQLNFRVTVQQGPVKLNPAEHSHFFILSLQSPEYAKLNISPECREVIGHAFNR